MMGRARAVQHSTPRPALGTLRIGAVALGAFALGALAIGALAIGRLSVQRARIERLEIGELVLRRPEPTEAETPPTPRGL